MLSGIISLFALIIAGVLVELGVPGFGLALASMAIINMVVSVGSQVIVEVNDAIKDRDNA